MKKTILGIPQALLVKHGLDATDALILAFLIDFIKSGQMDTRIIDDKQFYWVSYKNIIRQLPCLQIKTVDSIARRFRKYVKAGILEHRTSHRKYDPKKNEDISGKYSFYRFIR